MTTRVSMMMKAMLHAQGLLAHGWRHQVLGKWDSNSSTVTPVVEGNSEKFWWKILVFDFRRWRGGRGICGVHPSSVNPGSTRESRYLVETWICGTILWQICLGHFVASNHDTVKIYLPSHEMEKGHFSDFPRTGFVERSFAQFWKNCRFHSRLISPHLSWAHPTCASSGLR